MFSTDKLTLLKLNTQSWSQAAERGHFFAEQFSDLNLTISKPLAVHSSCR